MKGLYFSALLAISALLVGCGSTPTMESHSVPAGKSAATIAGYSKRQGMTVWENFAIETVNDKFITGGFFSGPAGRVVRVESGKNKVLITANFNRGLFGAGPFTALIPVEANIEPSTAYRINGKIEGDGVSAWIEAIESKKIASTVVKRPFTRAPQTNYVPIYLP